MELNAEQRHQSALHSTEYAMQSKLALVENDAQKKHTDALLHQRVLHESAMADQAVRADQCQSDALRQQQQTMQVEFQTIASTTATSHADALHAATSLLRTELAAAVAQGSRAPGAPDSVVDRDARQLCAECPVRQSQIEALKRSLNEAQASATTLGAQLAIAANQRVALQKAHEELPSSTGCCPRD